MLCAWAQVKAGCEVLAAQARRSGRPVPKSVASPGDVATPDDHVAFFRGERQVPQHSLSDPAVDIGWTLRQALPQLFLQLALLRQRPSRLGRHASHASQELVM